MKKLLAVVLAAMMVLSLGVVSFAAEVAKKDTVKATYTWYTPDGEIMKVDGVEAKGPLEDVAFDRIDSTTDLVEPDSTVWVSLGSEGYYTNKGKTRQGRQQCQADFQGQCCDQRQR